MEDATSPGLDATQAAPRGADGLDATLAADGLDATLAPDIGPAALAATYAATGGRGADGDATLSQGDVVGRYVVLGKLGAGGMGVVYAAYDPELDRKVALKLLRPGLAAAGSVGESDARTRLLREAQALARLGHPNVVAVHDVGAVAGRVWLAMEFVEGRTLGAWSSERPRSTREVIDVMTRAGRGLAAAHQAGLVHRDFKPKTRSLLGRPPFSPSGRILKNRGVSRQGPWRVVPPDAAGLATAWQRFRARRGRVHRLPACGRPQTSAATRTPQLNRASLAGVHRA